MNSNFNHRQKFFNSKPCILKERENFKLNLRKEKIEELFLIKRKVKIYTEKTNENIVPKEIESQFKNFELIHNKKAFILNFLNSDNFDILLFCCEQYNDTIFHLELNGDKFLLFKDIFDKEIIDFFFILLIKHYYLPLQKEIIRILHNLVYFDIFSYENLGFFHLNVFQTLLENKDLIKPVLQLLNNIFITESFSFDIDAKILEYSLHLENNSIISNENLDVFLRIIMRIILKYNYNQQIFPLEFLIKCLFNLFSLGDTEIWYKTLRITNELLITTQSLDNFIQIFHSTGFLKKLLSLSKLEKLGNDTIYLILLIYTNITNIDNQDYIHQLIEMGMLSQLYTLSDNLNEYKFCLSPLFITLSNICADSLESTLSVYEEGFFHSIIPLIHTITSSTIRFNSLFFLSVSSQVANYYLTKKLFKIGLLEAYISSIRFGTNTDEIYTAIEGLYFTLRNGNNSLQREEDFNIGNNIFAENFIQQDGIKHLEKHLFSKNEKISEFTEKILEEFFNVNTKEYRQNILSQLDEKENEISDDSSIEEEDS